MDERSLRGLLRQALDAEPPLGPVARNALRAGIRRRWRRRAQGATACAAVIAAAVVAIPALAGAPHGGPAPGGHLAPPPPPAPAAPVRLRRGPEPRASPAW